MRLRISACASQMTILVAMSFHPLASASAKAAHASTPVGASPCPARYTVGMSWPPYRLMERDYLAEAKEKFARLERLYHVGYKQAWDGKQVLADLLHKHGGVR